MDADRLRSAVDWRDGRLEVVDQTLLPGQFRVVELATVAEVVDALRRLVVRGAPAIGVAAAFGVVLGLDPAIRVDPDDLAEARAALHRAAAELEAARPTAVNLRWAARRVVAAATAAGGAGELRRLALAEAQRILEEDRAACRRIGEAGRVELASRPRLLTHCNTGRLATAGLGTALAVVYAKAAAGEPVEVLASETRPLLQGARLTAWELVDAGIPVTVLADTAAGGGPASSSAATGSPATATPPTRSAPTRWPCWRTPTGCRSTWSGRSPRSTRRRPTARASSSSSGRPPRSAPWRAPGWPPRRPLSGTPPSTSPPRRW
jgi:methylthioribose-1-phosphate isomerase